VEKAGRIAPESGLIRAAAGIGVDAEAVEADAEAIRAADVVAVPAVAVAAVVARWETGVRVRKEAVAVLQVIVARGRRAADALAAEAVDALPGSADRDRKAAVVACPAAVEKAALRLIRRLMEE
jgi:hypothetical protein